MASGFTLPVLPGGSGQLSTVMLLIIAIVGIKVAPWQLFFQQSYVIDKRAKGFYALCGGLVAAAATVVLIPGSPLGLLTEGVQTLAGCCCRPRRCSCCCCVTTKRSSARG